MKRKRTRLLLNYPSMQSQQKAWVDSRQFVGPGLEQGRGEGVEIQFLSPLTLENRHIYPRLPQFDSITCVLKELTIPWAQPVLLLASSREAAVDG